MMCHPKHTAYKAEILHVVHHLLYLNSVNYHSKYLFIRQLGTCKEVCHCILTHYLMLA